MTTRPVLYWPDVHCVFDMFAVRKVSPFFHCFASTFAALLVPFASCMHKHQCHSFKFHSLRSGLIR